MFTAPLLFAALLPSAPPEPLSLHPKNPHYFLFRDKPTVLVTSAEHYGAVINTDFEYGKYLDTLAADGLNLTRLWVGPYCEPPGAFGIADNTLAPKAGKVVFPWARSDQPGYANGGNKFDLTKWDDAFSNRLKDFVTKAGKAGVVVEVNLFCPYYEEAMWKLSPFHEANNVNGFGKVKRTDVYTLDRHGGLLKLQEEMIRKVVSELQDFDNVYYEICNEPYFGGVTLEWQHHIADTIAVAEKGFPHRHLISQNIANYAARVSKPHPAVSVFNFHYASPPDAVAWNFGLNKALGDNETGFRGIKDVAYRTEGWDFLIAGGGLFNNLDYSFTTAKPDGTHVVQPGQPGGGSLAFRKQMKVLKDFIHGFDFVAMKPDNSVIKGELPGLTARALVESAKQYAVYLRPAIARPFSVRWHGFLEAAESGEHTLHVAFNNRVKVWLGEKPVIEADTADSFEKERSAVVTLEAGKKVPIKIDFVYTSGNASLRLMWSAKGVKKSVIPKERLSPAAGDGRGLSAEYFAGADFKDARLKRVDEKLDFRWGTASPLPVEKRPDDLKLTLALPKGTYRAEWVNPLTGKIVGAEDIAHVGGDRALSVPKFEEDLALRLVAK
jgi:PA14 domain